MSTQVVALSPYPAIEDVLNLARVYVNDTFTGATGTPGEGRIFTDTAPFILPLLNTAISEYQRRLSNLSVPTLIRQIIMPNVTPINGGSGVGVPDPAVFVTIGWTGYFDGTVEQVAPTLPSDLLIPLKLMERSTGTDLTFSDMEQAQSGLTSRYQGFSLEDWEFRHDGIHMNGALVAKDILMRYVASYALPIVVPPGQTPTAYFTATTIPFRDGSQPLAYLMAEAFCASRLPDGGTADLLAKADIIIRQIAMRYIRTRQRASATRSPYGEAGDMFGWFGG